MSRIKGWKKAYDGKTSIKYYNLKNNALEVRIRYFKNWDVWKVEIDDWSLGGIHLGNFFPNKSSALKAAINWMKRHPRG